MTIDFFLETIVVLFDVVVVGFYSQRLVWQKIVLVDVVFKEIPYQFFYYELGNLLRSFVGFLQSGNVFL